MPTSISLIEDTAMMESGKKVTSYESFSYSLMREAKSMKLQPQGKNVGKEPNPISSHCQGKLQWIYCQHQLSFPRKNSTKNTSELNSIWTCCSKQWTLLIFPTMCGRKRNAKAILKIFCKIFINSCPIVTHCDLIWILLPLSHQWDTEIPICLFC